jgi:branched-chain amino acid transport system substrate-binding protein
VRRPLPVLAGLALLAATACDDGANNDAADTDEPITVGYITPLTGDFSPLGTDNELAVELAVQQINDDGGVLGRELELITHDDQSNPDQAVLAFNDLMDDEPAAIIGSAFSNSAMALLEQVEREQIPYISPTPADEQVDPVRDHVFVVPALAGHYAERALEYFADEGMTSIAVAYSETSYGIAGYEALEAAADDFGIELEVVEEFEQDTTDYGHILADVESADVDATLFWGTGPPGVIFAEQYAGAELDTPLVVTGSQASPLWTEPAGDAAEGVTVLSALGVVGEHLPEGEHRDVITEMSQAFEDEHGYPPPQFAQDGYSAVMVLVAAIEEADSADRADIRDALEDLSLVTPNGTFNYSETDHSGLSTDAIAVNTVEDGEFVPTEWTLEQFDIVYGEE